MRKFIKTASVLLAVCSLLTACGSGIDTLVDDTINQFCSDEFADIDDSKIQEIKDAMKKQ